MERKLSTQQWNSEVGRKYAQRTERPLLAGHRGLRVRTPLTKIESIRVFYLGCEYNFTPLRLIIMMLIYRGYSIRNWEAPCCVGVPLMDLDGMPIPATE